MRKLLIGLVMVIAIGYLSAMGVLYFFQRSFQYHPDKNIKEVSAYDLPSTQDLMIKSVVDGASVQVWYHEPTRPGMPMVLFLHGNAGTLGYRAPKFKELIDMGFGFAAPAYHGFSKSEGKPTAETIFSDVITTIDFLKDKGFEAKNIIIVGESLGTGIAVEMAAKQQFAGVFLITPYTSIANRAQEMYWYFPIKSLVKDNFSSEDKIDKINAPLLIVHGTNDTVIPHSHAERLIELAREPKKIIIYPGFGHSNLDNATIFHEMKKYFIDEQKIGNQQ